MHLANQSSRKLDKLSQGSSKLDKLSKSSRGDTLDKKGSHRSQGQNPDNPRKQSSESREAEQRGTLGQGTIKTVDYQCCRKLVTRHKT